MYLPRMAIQTATGEASRVYSISHHRNTLRPSLSEKNAKSWGGGIFDTSGICTGSSVTSLQSSSVMTYLHCFCLALVLTGVHGGKNELSQIHCFVSPQLCDS